MVQYKTYLYKIILTNMEVFSLMNVFLCHYASLVCLFVRNLPCSIQ